MKNMSPKVVRPKTLVTKTVTTGPLTSKPMKGNEGPCCCEAGKGERLQGVRDVVQSPHRTVYAKGF